MEFIVRTVLPQIVRAPVVYAYSIPNINKTKIIL